MKLKFWEETFCQAYAANGGNAIKAYSEARPDAAQSSCRTEGYRTLQKEYIQDRIGEIQQKSMVSRFLNAEERRQFLADTVRANPWTVMEDKPHLAQAVTVTRRILDTGEVEEKVQVKLPDKLKALALDAQMTGEMVPAQSGTASPIASALDALMGLGGPSPAPAPAPLALPPSQEEGDEDLL
jgi:phage terminase small subunit